MTTLKQLKTAKPGDYIKISWPDYSDIYYKIKENSNDNLLLSYPFFGLWPYKKAYKKGYLRFNLEIFYKTFPKLKIIPKNSKKARSIEEKLSA
ncbi:MAG: hypothetical protein QW041_01050 [Candidatus Pacearchaeota archaeon]